jgi:hypothetical protein
MMRSIVRRDHRNTNRAQDETELEALSNDEWFRKENGQIENYFNDKILQIRKCLTTCQMGQDAAVGQELSAFANRDGLLRLTFYKIGEAEAHDPIIVYYCRARPALGFKDRAYTFLRTNYMLSSVTRVFAVTVTMSFLFLLIGILIEIFIVATVKMCNILTSNARFQYALGGVGVAVIILILTMLAMKGRPVEMSAFGIVSFLLLPLTQLIVSITIWYSTWDCIDGNADNINGNCPGTYYYFFGHFYTLWSLFGASIGFLLGLNVFDMFRSAVGDFPNHSTAVMQPFADSQVFDLYAEAGKRAIRQIPQNDD